MLPRAILRNLLPQVPYTRFRIESPQGAAHPGREGRSLSAGPLREPATPANGPGRRPLIDELDELTVGSAHEQDAHVSRIREDSVFKHLRIDFPQVRQNLRESPRLQRQVTDPDLVLTPTWVGQMS